MNQKQRNNYSEEFRRVNRRFEELFFPKVYKALKSKISSLTYVIKQKGPQAGLDYISTNLVNADLSNIVKNLYLEVGLRHARKTTRYIREIIRPHPKKNRSVPMETKGFGFNAEWTAFILNYLQEFLLQKITYDVSANTREKLVEVMQEAIAEGWGIDETVNHLEDLPFTKSQAARITRTEINRAANVGTMAGVDTSEYEMNKEWISAHDIRTRGMKPKDHASHVGLDAQVIDFSEDFIDPINGDHLQFPGDPKASAASTVNCRCSVAPIPKRDAVGNLVPKPAAYLAPVLGIFKPPIAASPNIGLRVTR